MKQAMFFLNINVNVFLLFLLGYISSSFHYLSSGFIMFFNQIYCITVIL